jgi:prolipoprotein diacylglyceryltransferase
MFPIIQLGPLAIQTPGLFLLISIWIGLSLAGKRSQEHGIHSEVLDNLVLTSLAGFVIGGRLVYVLGNISTFMASPFDLLSLNYSLFDLTGGVASAILTGLVFGRRKMLSFWPTLDALTPFFATLMIGIGAAHLASGEAFGQETSLPWGIEVFGATRHPSQVYEVAFAIFILSLIGLRKPFEFAGKQFLLFVAFSAGASLFLDAFRGDIILVAGGLRLGQIIAWMVLVLTLITLEQLEKSSRSIIQAEKHG